MGWLRCPVLKRKNKETKRMKGEAEKMLEEKDFKIQELEMELQSQKQKNEELSKELAEAKSGVNSMSTKKDSTCHIFRAILNEKSKVEIERLVELGADWKKPNDDGDSVLHVAARTGNHRVVDYFISLGAEVNARNANGTTPLMEAARAKENFAEIVDLLIRNGADLKATNKAGESALFIAVETGKNVKEIEMLCFENFLMTTSPNDKNRNTVLHKAAASGNLGALEYFVSQQPDVNVNVRNRQGRTPLMVAASAEENFLPIVDLLLKTGADIHVQDYFKDNLLRFAIKCGKPVEDLKKLVEAGACWNTDTKGIFGNGILTFCIRHAHVEAVKYFIKKGADLFEQNHLDWPDWGPLVRAAESGMTEVIDILIQKGAQHPRVAKLLRRRFEILFLRVPTSVEALERLWEYGVNWNYSGILNGYARDGNLQGISYCLLKGADINREDSGANESPIYCAVTGPNPKLETVEYLITMGADVKKVGMRGLSLVHCVAGNPSPNGPILAIIKKLVSSGVTWSNGLFGGWDNWKESILHAAARGGHPEVVQYFISEGADVDCKDNVYGDTPFLHAVRKATGEYLPEVFRVLVKGGADPNARDFDGNNAFLIGLSRCKNMEGLLTLEQMKVLVALGCDWRIPNKTGVTVLKRLQKKKLVIGKSESKVLEYFKSLGQRKGVGNFE